SLCLTRQDSSLVCSLPRLGAWATLIFRAPSLTSTQHHLGQTRSWCALPNPDLGIAAAPCPAVTAALSCCIDTYLTPSRASAVASTSTLTTSDAICRPAVTQTVSIRWIVHCIGIVALV
ncbi:hypothetical protein CFAM422_008190, partial [Trichoderma lentiforme]